VDHFRVLGASKGSLKPPGFNEADIFVSHVSVIMIGLVLADERKPFKERGTSDLG
jgi:hypothetical protein